MLDGYLALGGVEIANHARLQAYLESVGSPLDSGSAVCGCDTFTAGLVGDLPYTSPELDGAPWWDPDVPESGEFAGLLVLTVDGLDDFPMTRSVTRAAAGGAALGPARVLPRTITVTGVLLGSTCCGVEYGLRWLGQALQGCAGAGCGGDCMTVYNCCPGEDMDPFEFDARHRRTLRRVALVEGPRVVARAGDGCGSGRCQVGADLLTVEFVLTAATPWLWADPVPVLEVPVPSDAGAECVTWCVHGPPGEPCAGGCRHAPCGEPGGLCGDPFCRTPTPPAPPQPDTCFCRPLAVNTAFYELDLSAWPAWFGSAPIVDVFAGGADLRRVTVSLFERRPEHDGLSCERVADVSRCEPHTVFEVGFVPAGGVVTLDGQVGRAVVECGGVCEASGDVYGRDGGPLRFDLLDCDRYCVMVESDVVFAPAADASISVSLSGRDY